MNGPLFPRPLYAHLPAETEFRAFSVLVFVVPVVMAAGTVGDVRADAKNCTI